MTHTIEDALKDHPDLREIVLLLYRYRLTQRDVAHLKKTSQSTVQRQLRLALNILRATPDLQVNFSQNRTN